MTHNDKATKSVNAYAEICENEKITGDCEQQPVAAAQWAKPVLADHWRPYGVLNISNLQLSRPARQ